MTLRAVHSNRVEALFGALVAALPPPDPFAPQTIVVGSHVMARWLAREIALTRGIFAGIHVVSFDRFVEQTWADPAGSSGLIGMDRDQLAAAIASVLVDDSFVATLPPVAAYLAAAPGPGDRAGPRRVQLGNHLARLAWTYATTRPDWMAEFAAGQPGKELAADPTARWQAAIVRTAIARLGHRNVAPIPMLPWLRRRAGLPPPQLAPVHVFGLSYFHRAQLEALTDLASTTDVTVYLQNPCAELWDDVSGRSSAPPKQEPMLLPLWGRALKDTLAAIIERTGGDLEDAFVPGSADTARDALLSDTAARTLRPRHTSAGPGVQILACANPRRELEAIATAIRAQLDSHDDLRANQIAVWIASDVDTYLALAPSALEAVGVPCHLIDSPVDDRGRIGEAVLAILELPTSAMTRSDLLRIMTHPAVLANHPHVDSADWVRWTERLGIVHGRDASSFAGTYLADHSDKFHWDQGVRRLALGAYMVGAERGAARIADMDVVPEEVAPEKQASAATYALLVRSLVADAAWLAGHEATLRQWSEIFVAVVDSYLGTSAADEARAEPVRDIERVAALLAGIARVDIDQRRVGFREARQHAVSRIVAARQDRGEPLAHGVTVGPLRIHRAIPFELACVVGLNEGEFPASEHESPLDLRAHAPARPGDVTARDRDRHAFFEVVLGVRRQLVLSYVSVEPTSGAPLAPSSVVLELADALAPYVGATSSREAIEVLTQRQPLHRFLAQGETLPPEVARERWAVRVREAICNWLRARDYPVPNADGMLALLAHPSLTELRAELGMADTAVATPASGSAGGVRPQLSAAGDALEPRATVRSSSREPPTAISIAQIRRFLESPIQAWAKLVLDLDDIPDDAAVDHSEEPFAVERPTRAVLLREVLGAYLRAPEVALEDYYDAIAREFVLRGQFPVGVFGQAARAVDLRTLNNWRAALGPVAVGTVTRLAFGRALPTIGPRKHLASGVGLSMPEQVAPAIELALDVHRTVRLVGATELIALEGGRATSFIPVTGTVDGKSRYHVRGALDHLALAAAGLATSGHDHILVDPEGNAKRVSHEPWTPADARDYLAGVMRELLDAPHGYLLPFDLLAHALGGSSRSGDVVNDPTGGLGFGPLERPDGLAVPTDAQQIARRRLGPLVARMRGDHTFEVP